MLKKWLSGVLKNSIKTRYKTQTYEQIPWWLFIKYGMLEDLRLTDEYKAIKLFNYKSDNFSESIEQCRDSFIVVDNADNLMNDEVRKFINFEPSNQYMLFLRNCDGLNVSDMSFKVLKFDNNRITLEEELWYEIFMDRRYRCWTSLLEIG